jgi:hypothetical protein
MTAYFGNFQLMAMGLSALAMLWIWRGRTRSGAALLAFTVGAKIFPGILGVYLLAARRFAAAAWTAAFAALYALLALACSAPGRSSTSSVITCRGWPAARRSRSSAAEGSMGSTSAVFGLPFKLRAPAGPAARPTRGRSRPAIVVGLHAR